MRPLDWAATFLVVLIWGLNFVVIKTGVREFTPLFLTGIRFTAVAILLIPFFRPPKEKLLGILLLSTIMGVGHFGLLVLGLSRLDAASAGIAIQLGVPFSSMLAAIFFQDRLGRVQCLGMALAFGGVVMLAGEPAQPELAPLFTVVAAALGWAVANVVIKRLQPVHPLALNGCMALFAAPQLLILSVLFESGHVASLINAGWRGWGAVGYTTLAASLTAYTLWYHLMGKYPMNRLVPLTLLVPAIAIAGGVMILGEPLTMEKFVGGLLTIMGVAVIQVPFAGQKPAKR